MQYNSSDDDSNLILQRNLLHECRRSFRSCETPAKRFEVCAEYRDSVLEKHAAVQALAAKIEGVMLEECEEYQRRKHYGFKETETGEAASWKRFVSAAHEGRQAIDKCLVPLRSVRKHWGEEIVQHYGWVDRGEMTCNALRSVARKNSWKEFIIKQNQVALRRTHIARRRKMRRSIDPIDISDLKNVKRWQTGDPYVKEKDPDNLQLQYRSLTPEHLPEEFGFDKYGLMVYKEFSTAERITTAFLDRRGSVCSPERSLDPSQYMALREISRPLITGSIAATADANIVSATSASCDAATQRLNMLEAENKTLNERLCRERDIFQRQLVQERVVREGEVLEAKRRARGQILRILQDPIRSFLEVVIQDTFWEDGDPLKVDFSLQIQDGSISLDQKFKPNLWAEPIDQFLKFQAKRHMGLVDRQYEPTTAWKENGKWKKPNDIRWGMNWVRERKRKSYSGRGYSTRPIKKVHGFQPSAR